MKLCHRVAQIHHARQRGPAGAGPQAVRERVAQEKEERRLALGNDLLCPVGRSVELPADQMKEQESHGRGVRTAVSKDLEFLPGPGITRSFQHAGEYASCDRIVRHE